MGQLVFQATLGGQVNLVGPNTASTYNINVPTVTGTMVTTGDTGTVTNTMCATSVYTAPGTIGSGTPNTGAFTTLSGSTSVTTPIVKSASSLTLQTNGTTTAVTIDTSQNVGIGTSSPSTYSSATKNVVSVVRSNQSITLGSYFESGVGQFGFINSSNGAGTDTGIPLVFQQGTAERARIDSSGNLLVGRTTSTAPDTTTGAMLYSSGFLSLTANAEAGSFNRQGSDGTVFQFRRANTIVGAINVTGSSTAYVTSSDYRLKENIQPMQGALAVVQQLNPVTYNWKADGSDGQGFIAHELQAVVPDCVTGEKDAVETYVDEEGNEQTRPLYQGIDTSFLVATLTAAIQELSSKNDALETRLAALEAK